MLDTFPVGRELPFEEWWGEVVLMDDRRATMSRRDLVLSVADQDGGAHVDPALNETYARLTRQNSLGWTVTDGKTTRPVRKVERAALRQIAHEVFKGLIPGYTKHLEEQDAGMFVGGMMAYDGVPGGFGKTPGRNDPCFCASGKKYKKCHGAPAT